MKFVFTRTTGFWPWLIRLIAGGEWDHVAVVDGDYVVEASMADDEVRRRRLDSLLADRPDHEIVEFPCRTEISAIGWLNEQIDKPYDRGALWWFVFPWRDFSDADKWECFELAGMAAIKAGKTLPGNVSHLSGRQLWRYATMWRTGR